MDRIQNVIPAALTNLQMRTNGTTFPVLSDANESCPICGGKGYTVKRVDGCIVSHECKCAVIARNRRRIEKSGLLHRLELSRFDNYQTPEKWQEVAKETARRYIDNWRGKWFYIGGASGSGKSHLCTALCGQLMAAGIDLIYLEWRAESPRIKALVNDPDAYQREMERLKGIYVLYIDDFLKGSPTEADRNLAFDLLNARYNNPDTATIISSERTVQQLLAWDEAIGSRIFERTEGFLVEITGKGKNWRTTPHERPIST